MHVWLNAIGVHATREGADPVTTAGRISSDLVCPLVSITIRRDATVLILIETVWTVSTLPGILALQVQACTLATALQSILNAVRRDAIARNIDKSTGATAAIIARPSRGTDAAIDSANRPTSSMVTTLIACVTANDRQANSKHSKHSQHFITWINLLTYRFFIWNHKNLYINTVNKLTVV